MITFHDGDLLKSGCDIICHQVNCKGVMGAGLAKQIKTTYPWVYNFYKSHCDQKKPEELLGCIDIISLDLDQYPWSDEAYIVNLYAQESYGRKVGVVYTDYLALRRCLMKLRTCLEDREFMTLKNQPARIGIPYNLGCGLAGGSWSAVYAIIEEVLGDQNVEIWRLEK